MVEEASLLGRPRLSRGVRPHVAALLTGLCALACVVGMVSWGGSAVELSNKLEEVPLPHINGMYKEAQVARDMVKDEHKMFKISESMNAQMEHMETDQEKPGISQTQKVAELRDQMINMQRTLAADKPILRDELNELEEEGDMPVGGLKAHRMSQLGFDTGKRHYWPKWHGNIFDRKSYSYQPAAYVWGEGDSGSITAPYSVGDPERYHTGYRTSTTAFHDNITNSPKDIAAVTGFAWPDRYNRVIGDEGAKRYRPNFYMDWDGSGKNIADTDTATEEGFGKQWSRRIHPPTFRPHMLQEGEESGGPFHWAFGDFDPVAGAAGYPIETAQHADGEQYYHRASRPDDLDQGEHPDLEAHIKSSTSQLATPQQKAEIAALEKKIAQERSKLQATGPARMSELLELPAHKHQKALQKETALTMRQDRQGLIADERLGRYHGCKPEQLRLWPHDDDECDPLALKMQPGIDRYWNRVKNERYKTLGGVHWTSGDVPPEDDAFPVRERGGGYTGIEDIEYPGDRVHPTVFTPAYALGPGKVKYPTGTKAKTTSQLRSDVAREVASIEADLENKKGHAAATPKAAEGKAAAASSKEVEADVGSADEPGAAAPQEIEAAVASDVTTEAPTHTAAPVEHTETQTKKNVVTVVPEGEAVKVAKGLVRQEAELQKFAKKLQSEEKAKAAAAAQEMHNVEATLQKAFPKAA